MEKLSVEIQAFWQAFLRDSGQSRDKIPYSCFSFGTGEMADRLLELVLIGKKRATTSCEAAYEKEGERLPCANDLSIVLNRDGAPKCVIQNIRVRTLPFSQMTWELAKKEGEDETLADWQANHVRFFEEGLKSYGISFTPELPVVFEEFEKVYPMVEKS